MRTMAYLTCPTAPTPASSLETSRFARSRKASFVNTVTCIGRSVTNRVAKMHNCLPSAIHMERTRESCASRRKKAYSKLTPRAVRQQHNVPLSVRRDGRHPVRAVRSMEVRCRGGELEEKSWGLERAGAGEMEECLTLRSCLATDLTVLHGSCPSDPLTAKR